MKNRKIIIFIIIGLMLAFSYYSQNLDKSRDLNSQADFNLLETGAAAENFSLNSEAEENDLKIVVHLAGAVKNPGVYKLNKSDRLVDLIRAAGGLEENADIKLINLAERLYDGQKLIIPELIKNIAQNTNDDSLLKKRGENSINNFSSSSSSNLININQADQSDLEKLSGIGPAKAAAIIKYREENNYFSKKNDLLKISGIGEKTLENIQDEIVLQ